MSDVAASPEPAALSAVEANKAAARRFLEQFETRTYDYEALYHPDYVHHNEAFYPGLKPGLAAFREALREHGGGFGDLELKISHLVGEGDLVVARMVVTATHSGAFHGIPATGRRITFTATDIYRFEDGRIAEGWAVIDWLAILQQTGAAPAA